MSNDDPTIQMTQPPISCSRNTMPQEALFQRGAFDPPATPGTIGRLDRFELLRLLGEGGMGQVYLAREPVTDTLVAIKVMQPKFADDPQVVHRFLTEARHMYRLSHPRILRVLEVSDRKESPYYVMPYIEGGSLLGHCNPDQPLSAERILPIAQQVAEALAHAHAHGLIHRDLKPANVLLDKDGNAYLTDFGLVRSVYNDSQSDSDDRLLNGTAHYLSPAVAAGEAEDTRCDIYAFGALLYEMLVGDPPYSGRSVQIILSQILQGPPSPIRFRNPKANPALTKIAEGCMARELRDRYASMTDVISDFNRAAKGQVPFGPHHQQNRVPRVAALLIGTMAIATMGCLAIYHYSAGRNSVLSQQTSIQSPLSAVRTQATVPVEITPLPFTYATNNNAITLIKYTGPAGTVTIPKTINGLPVTAIGYSAFVNRNDLTHVQIPTSVTTIADTAFYGCWGLTNLAIPKSVTSIGNDWLGVNSIVVDTANPAYCSTSDGVLFNKDKSSLIHYPVSKTGGYVIPASVTKIMDAAFNCCTNLTSVTIPTNVTQIASWVFSGCTSLTNVLIPESVTAIGRGAFRNTGLTHVFISKKIASIEADSFIRCRRLTAFAVDSQNPNYSSSQDGVLFNKDATCLITYPGGKNGSYEIPETVNKIGQYAFSGCRWLTSVTIPKNVSSIGSEAFSACDNLSAIGFKGDAPWCGNSVFDLSNDLTVYYLPGSKGWGPTFGERPTSVWDGKELSRAAPLQSHSTPSYTFTTNNGTITITKYIGPGGRVTLPRILDGLPVTVIGESAFEYSKTVTSITIPNSIIHIEDKAFHHCPLLATVTLPTSLISIGERTFSCCTSLTRMRLPASLTSIGHNSFNNCGKLLEIHVETGNPAYSSADGVLFDKAMTCLIYYPVGKSGDYVIPGTVTRISPWAFYGATRLTSLLIPASVTFMDTPFGSCYGLSSIRVDANNPAYSSTPDGVLFNKEKNCLLGYPGGKGGNYEIPTGVSTVNRSAFQDCYYLTGVIIPDSVRTLEAYSFRNCANLTELYFKGNAPNLGGDVFKSTTKATVYYIPETKGWSREFGGRPTAIWKEDAR